MTARQKPRKPLKVRELTDDERDYAMTILGEAFHTAFRKGCEDTTGVWLKIRDMPDDEYNDAIRFVVDGLDFSGLRLIPVEISEIRRKK